MKVVIVIPTYNEAENVKRIVPEVLAVTKQIPDECHILIVDGNSPDGTGQLVNQMAQGNDYVHLLMEKEKSGLGGAYIYAFKYAMQEMRAEVIMEMDADFQHDPKEIPHFISKIKEGHDYVIGSRFTKGGSIPKDWGLSRKVFSIGGNYFSKMVLGIHNVSDFTSGYKASRVQGYMDMLDLDSVRSKGFAYKIDLLYKMYKLGARIAEIPIEFALRDKGESKMERNNPVESLKVVLSIKIDENKQFVRFLCAGVAGVLTDAFLFNLFRVTVFTPALSAVFSGFIAMMVTFTINNLWSFRDRKIEGLPKILLTFILYAGASVIPILLRSELVRLFVDTLGNSFFVANMAFLLGVVIGLIWNYTVYSKIIWRKNFSKE